MNGYDCQLKSVYRAGLNLNLLDRIGRFIIRLRAALNRRLLRIGLVKREDISLEARGQQKIAASNKLNDQPEVINEGDIVEILPLTEIEKILDNNHQTQGLVFMTAMKKYCGTQAKVLKKVHYIFDEQAWKMKKIKNTVILEGLLCRGEDMFSKEGCDRCCFFFWKEAWVKKV
jgi:hypothetical protein